MSYWFSDTAQTYDTQPRRTHQAIERVIPHNDASLYNTTTRKIDYIKHQQAQILSGQLKDIQQQQSLATTQRRPQQRGSDIVQRSQIEANRYYDMQQQQKQQLYKQRQAVFYDKLESRANKSYNLRMLSQQQEQHNNIVIAMKQHRNQQLKKLYNNEMLQYNKELLDKGLTIIHT